MSVYWGEGGCPGPGVHSIRRGRGGVCDIPGVAVEGGVARVYSALPGTSVSRPPSGSSMRCRLPAASPLTAAIFLRRGKKKPSSGERAPETPPTPPPSPRTRRRPPSARARPPFSDWLRPDINTGPPPLLALWHVASPSSPHWPPRVVVQRPGHVLEGRGGRDGPPSPRGNHLTPYCPRRERERGGCDPPENGSRVLQSAQGRA